MSGIEETLSEREEIEMLLPWYVTGRLDAADRDRVEAYLAREPDMRRQLAPIVDEQQAAVAGNEAIRPRLASAEALLAQTATPPGAAQSWFSGVVEAIKELFEAPTPGAVRWAAAAAAVVIGLQLVAVGTLLTRDGAGYQTASRPDVETHVAAEATIAFADTASVADIARLLAEHRLRIVDGPLPGGFFGVRFDDGATAGERQRRLTEIASRKDLVKAVLPGR